MSFLTSLKEYAAPITRRLDDDGGGGGSSGVESTVIVRSGVPPDPLFENARKDWQRLNAFFTALHESYVASVASLRDAAKPSLTMQRAICAFLDDNKASSAESQQFASSIAKFNEGTMKFGEMMSSYNIKEELESWLAKLAEIKREINQRDMLISKHAKDDASCRSAKQKAEAKGLLRDAATVVKLNKMDAEIAQTKESYETLTAKIINDLKGMQSRTVPLLNEQIKTIATSHFWLWWMLSEGYSFWHQQEVNRSSMRDRPVRRGGRQMSMAIKPTDAGKPLPSTPGATQPATPATPATPSAEQPASPVTTGKALPTPPPKKNVAAPSSSATTTTTAPATPLSAQDKRILDIERQGILEERREVDDARARLKEEWDEVEQEKVKWMHVKKDEFAKINEEKLRQEEEFKARLRELENKQRLLEDERRAVSDEKARLEKKIKLEEERAERRKAMEEDYKKMEDERKLLEEQKLKIVEEKMKKKLEDEWRRVEQKRLEIEEQRKKEEERRRDEEKARLEEEQKRLEWEAEERKRREEEQLLEEAREKERIDRVRRQMDEERRRLQQTKKRLEIEGDSVDIPTSSFGSFREALSGDRVQTSVTTKEADKAAEETVKLFVRALYKYDAKEDGELSFDQGEVLEVEYDGDSSGWWLGRKKAGAGEEGLVPANFVVKVPAEEKPVTSAEIKKPEEAKVAEPAKPIEETSVAPKDNPTESVSTSAAATPAIATNSKIAATAVVGGQVRATHDYAAVEEGELSFKKGDIITLLECDPAGGWWIGEVGPDMGLFPKTFVEAVATEEPASTAPVATPTPTPTPTPAPTPAPTPTTTSTTTTTAPTTTAPSTITASTAPPKIEVVKALYDYAAQEAGELGFQEDDVIVLIDKSGDGNDGWWTGRLLRNPNKEAKGIFPSNFASEPYFITSV